MTSIFDPSPFPFRPIGDDLDGPQIEGMLDLDALMEDVPEESLEDARAFALELKAQENACKETELPMRYVIGVWVARGKVNWPDTAMLLHRFGCYREVPLKDQVILPSLASDIVYLQIKKSPTSVAMYRAMQSCNVLMKFFSAKEQEQIFYKL